MTTTCRKTQAFFEAGTAEQFQWVLGLYDQCLRLKAEAKSTKPENVIKLDKWYQNELPKKIKARGNDAHLIHEDLVQVMKWKLARGKFRPNLVNLIQMNTPRVVMTETKKAFRNVFKKKDLFAGMSALCSLKGVGPATASAVLAAGAPDMAPFMADEVLLALPDTDGLDYTVKEYTRLVEAVCACVKRLNDSLTEEKTWNPHKVELAVWCYYIANDMKPELLEKMPDAEDLKFYISAEESGKGEQDAKKIDESSMDSVGGSTNASSSGRNSAMAGEESNDADYNGKRSNSEENEEAPAEKKVKAEDST